MGFPLTDQQKLGVEHRGSGALVSAAAGSGKTRVLVERLLNRVCDERLNIDRFLVITFTKAAAQELRGRIAKELSARLAQNPTDKHLRRQLTLVYKAQISTIHSFCSDLLRENGHFIDVSAGFRLCDEGESVSIMSEVVEELLEKEYVDGHPDFFKAVNTLAYMRDDSRLGQMILDIFGKIQSHQNPKKWLEEQQEIWELNGISDVAETVWGGLILTEITQSATYALTLLEEGVALAQEDEILYLNYGVSMEQTADLVRGMLEGCTHSWDAGFALLPIGFPTAGRKAGADPDLKERVTSLRTRAKKILDELPMTECSADLLGDLRETGGVVRTLLRLVGEFSDRFAQEKEKRNILDFVDLEHKTVKLLWEENGTPSGVARTKSSTFAEVMVDEYQDTNMVQNAIFDGITNGGETLFVVGDVKQSIYRFRLADPTIFLEKFRRFTAEKSKGSAIVLSQNFRSRPEVLHACNDLFYAIMSAQFGDVNYDRNHALDPRGTFPTAENNEQYRTKFALIDVSNAKGETPEQTVEKGEIEAKWVAKEIDTMLKNGFQVSKSGDFAKMTPDDVMILMRSPSRMLHHYIKALEDRNIPWSAKGEGNIFQTTEINVALSILKIIDNPHQDVPLLAALRSPIFGFSADELAKIKQKHSGDFYSCLLEAKRGGDPKVTAFLGLLDGLRFASSDMTARQMIWNTYLACQLLPIFGAMEGGEIRQGNLLELYALGGRFEEAGCVTLFDFLLRLEQMRRAENLPKRNQEASAGVTILSIHSSKGLEKPIVFVCGLAREINLMDSQDPVIFHQKYGVGTRGLDSDRLIEYPTLPREAIAKVLRRESKSEEMRLLYVAMTRAQDKLIMTMTLAKGIDTVAKVGQWLPVSPISLERQNSVGNWVLLHALTRPECSQIAMEAGVQFREMLPTTSQWEIEFVACDQPEDCSVEGAQKNQTTKKQKIALTEGDIARVRASLGWRYPYESDVSAPSKFTATQTKGRLIDRTDADQGATLDLVGDTPIEMGKTTRHRTPSFVEEKRGISAADRGTAIHLMLQYLHFSPTLDCSLEGVTAKKEQLLVGEYLTKEQYRAINPKQICGFLQSPLGVRACSATVCKQEFAFSLLVEGCAMGMETAEKLLLQGVVDCWFEEADGITVIDFKSDYVTADTAEDKAREHEKQLAVYQLALERMLGKKVKRKVVWFFRINQGIEL